MKRRYFLFLFILIAFLFLYSPNYVQGQDGAQCFANSNKGFIDTQEESSDISVSYNYESLETKNWKIRVNKESYSIIVQDLNSEKIQTEMPLSISKSEKSELNCEYYSFSFSREAKNLVYILPRESTAPLEIGDKLYCKYSIVEIEQDVPKILALGGRALEISNICPDSREKELETGISECPETQSCEVAINSGEREFYGFSVEKDSCGNKIIEVDNSGNSFSESEIETRAEESVNTCKANVKAIIREQVKKETETGSDNENNQQQTQTQPSIKKSSSLFSCTGGVDNKLPECNDDKDNDRDSLIDCKTKSNGDVDLDKSDPGCFSCSTGKLKCNPNDEDETDGDLAYINCPEGQIQCGPYCYDSTKFQCGGVEKGVSNICDEGYNDLKALSDECKDSPKDQATCPVTVVGTQEPASLCTNRKACNNLKIVCDSCIKPMSASIAYATKYNLLFSELIVKLDTCSLNLNPEDAKYMGFTCQCGDPPEDNQIINYNSLKQIIENKNLDNAALSCIIAHELSHADTCNELDFEPFLCTNEEIAYDIEVKCLKKAYQDFCTNIPDDPRCNLINLLWKSSEEIRRFQNCICLEPSDGISFGECNTCLSTHTTSLNDKINLCGYCKKFAYEATPDYCNKIL